MTNDAFLLLHFLILFLLNCKLQATPVSPKERHCEARSNLIILVY